MGVGAAERMSKVRWGVAGEIMVAWVITIPATMLVGGLFYWLFQNALPAVLALF